MGRLFFRVLYRIFGHTQIAVRSWFIDMCGSQCLNWGVITWRFPTVEPQIIQLLGDPSVEGELKQCTRTIQNIYLMTYIYIYILIYTYILIIYIHTYRYTYNLHIYIYIYTYLYIHIYIYTYIYIYRYTVLYRTYCCSFTYLKSFARILSKSLVGCLKQVA